MAVNGSVSEEGVDDEEVSAKGDLDEAERGPARAPISRTKAAGRRLPIILIGATAIVAVAVIAVVVTSGSSKSKTTTPTTPPRPTFTAFQDKKAGFQLSYPSTWTTGMPNDPNVPLLLNFGAGGFDTLLIRVVPIEAAQVNTASATDIKAFTDAVISGTGVTVLKSQAVTVHNLPGYYYFYTLPKDASGVTLVHSHFFVFPPHEMVSLTFQTVDSDFQQFAAAFDQVVSSVQAIPVP
ncbi:MAG: hypothetical protein QOF30_1438 [Acidimicrobiaceae bacterium]|jgi:hypothetical protein|nr:hypothetical protein [Acidimicrobiaceae bacterium]